MGISELGGRLHLHSDVVSVRGNSMLRFTRRLKNLNGHYNISDIFVAKVQILHNLLALIF
jgi:hypothetical protein